MEAHQDHRLPDLATGTDGGFDEWLVASGRSTRKPPVPKVNGTHLRNLVCKLRVSTIERPEGPISTGWGERVGDLSTDRTSETGHLGRRRHDRNRSSGQSLVEFALIVPILFMVFIAIADFGRIFAASIAIEAATRDAAEAVANRYLITPPGPLDAPAPAGNTTYYSPLHDYGAGVVCAELRALPNTNFDSGSSTCPDMPVVMVCVHDSQDPGCSALSSPGTLGAPADCTSLSPPPDSGQGTLTPPRARWVEVRVCYHFTAILNLPLFSLGDFWLQRTNEFTIPCYFTLGVAECGDS